MSNQARLGRRHFLRTAGASLLGTMLAACGQQTSGPAAGDGAGQPAPGAATNDATAVPDSAATAPTSAGATAPAQVTGGERVVVWRGGPSVAPEDPILQAVSKATNTQVEVLNVGELTEKVNAGVASGDVPDIICTIDHSNRALLDQWVRDGVVAPFEGDVASAAPNVIAQYENNRNLNELKVDGKIYMQPVFWGNGFDPNAGIIHIRKDLLDKYGMQPPQTFGAYFDFLRAAVKDGQKGVLFGGEAGPGMALSAFAGAFNTPLTGWVKVDGRYQYGPVQPGVKDALLLFRQMVSEGLVNPVSWEGGEIRDMYVAGEGASLLFNGGGHIGRIQIDMDLAGEGAKNWVLAAPDAIAAKRGYTGEPMFWGVTLLGNMQNNNPVAAARVLNFLVSEKGTRLTSLGIPGKDYTGDTLETITLNPEERAKSGFPTAAGDTGAHPLATEIVSWVPQELQDFSLLYGKDEAFREWYRAMRENQTEYVIENVGQLSTSPQWSAFIPTSNELMNRTYLAVAQAASDDEATALFSQFVEEWKSAGGEAASAEMNDVLGRLYG